MKKRLLLHICCAPCVVYVWKKLEVDYDVTGFFYNPNIQPGGEYEFRKNELTKIARQYNWQVYYGEYDKDAWFEAVTGMEEEPERGRRCSVCFAYRLRKAFEFASRSGFEAVASTLSISPYKVTAQINQEGLALAREFNLEFLPENFKKKDGYNTGRKLALDLGIKHQDYCGCIFSRRDKEIKIP
jgi:predicted adenine nucleotide alpha hydrolase (AANH) superfamily ATPase